MLAHIDGLPPDSALSRRRLNAPMGWDNTAEMTATVVDSLAYLTRLFFNANFEPPNHEPVRSMPRPYEVASEPETISLHEFSNILSER